MNIFQRISLSWKTFTPLEGFLLNQLLNNIDADLKNITEHQINSITKTQRLLDWSEINYYCSKFDENFRYPNTNEIILAVIDFRLKGEKKKYKTKIYAVNGRLFSINTKPGVKDICFVNEFEIISFTIVDNPMNPTENSNLEKLYNHLPNEYLQFEGQTLNNWDIKPKNEIYSIQTNVGELFCIAQRLDEFICLTIENKKSELFYIQDHESEPTLLNKTFGESIKNI